MKAQVADQCGLADAVRAINNLAAAQGKKDSPSLIERPWSSKRILWQRGGFSTVVEEDGSVLCGCDPGV